MELLAFDIETTGLDPETDRLLAVGLAGRDRAEAALGPDEDNLLAWLETTVTTLPSGAVIVTWNGEEFDLPFIATRLAHTGLQSSLKLRPTGEVGKYGKPRHAATWAGHIHVDIAYPYQQRAEALGVKWSLKPVARAILGEDPIVVDRRGAAIARLDRAALEAYVLSDAGITYRLAQLLAEDGSFPTVG